MFRSVCDRPGRRKKAATAPASTDHSFALALTARDPAIGASANRSDAGTTGG